MSVPESPSATEAGAGAPARRWPSPNAVDALVVVLAAVALYANTLGVPPYLDDPAIINSPTVRDLGAAWRGILASRGLSLFTFALNYRLTGLDLAWLHATNVVIHAGTALLVLACIRRVFPGERLLALFGALVFAAHPLQTQAVTYLVQRMTSLAGLCLFGALLLFIRAREALAAGASPWSGRHALRYGGALLLAALAVQAKPNAATLPALALLFSWFFLPREGWPLRRLLAWVAPFAAVPLLLGGAALLAGVLGGATVIQAGQVGRVFGDEQVSPLRYFATEWGVLWTYLRLLAVPWGQALLYDTPIVASPLGAVPLLHLAGLVALLGVAAKLRRAWPTLLFGLAWFLVALSVESSFIPLDPAFEHRLYVPMFGFAAAAAGALSFVASARARWAVGAAVLLLLGGLTVRRNALWNDPIAFLEDNLARAPTSARLPSMLARAYRVRGREAEAEALLRGKLGEDGSDPRIVGDLAALLIDQERVEEAERVMEGVPAGAPDDPDLLVVEGRLREKRHDLDGAIAAFERAVQLEPTRAEIRLNLGLLQAADGRYSEAERTFRAALAADPGAAGVQYNLGVALARQGRHGEARDAFLQAASANPEDARPLFNAGVSSLRLGDAAGAEAVLPALARRSGADAEELRRRIDSARRAPPPP